MYCESFSSSLALVERGKFGWLKRGKFFLPSTAAVKVYLLSSMSDPEDNEGEERRSGREASLDSLGEEVDNKVIFHSRIFLSDVDFFVFLSECVNHFAFICWRNLLRWQRAWDILIHYITIATNSLVIQSIAHITNQLRDHLWATSAQTKSRKLFHS